MTDLFVANDVSNYCLRNQAWRQASGDISRGLLWSCGRLNESTLSAAGAEFSDRSADSGWRPPSLGWRRLSDLVQVNGHVSASQPICSHLSQLLLNDGAGVRRRLGSWAARISNECSSPSLVDLARGYSSNRDARLQQWQWTCDVGGGNYQSASDQRSRDGNRGRHNQATAINQARP